MGIPEYTLVASARSIMARLRDKFEKDPHVLTGGGNFEVVDNPDYAEMLYHQIRAVAKCQEINCESQPFHYGVDSSTLTIRRKNG